MGEIVQLNTRGTVTLSEVDARLEVLLKDLDKVPEAERDVEYYRRRKYSLNTSKAYRAGIHDFIAWTGVPFPFPTTANLICQYLVDRKHLAASTLRVYIAGIGYLHNMFRFRDPTNTKLEPTNRACDPYAQEIYDVLKGIEKEQLDEKRRIVLQAPPLTPDQLVAMLKVAGDNLMGLRDKAYLLVAAYGAFRQSEVSRLRWDQFHPIDGGYAVSLETTKQDQLNQEKKFKGLPLMAQALICPVQTLEAWIRCSCIVEGPVFRGVTRHGTLLKTAITHTTANRIVKKLAAKAGIAHPERFSGHSLRSTFITELRKQDVADAKIVKQTLQKTQTLQTYDRGEMALKDNPAVDFGVLLQDSLID